MSIEYEILLACSTGEETIFSLSRRFDVRDIRRLADLGLIEYSSSNGHRCLLTAPGRDRFFALRDLSESRDYAAKQQARDYARQREAQAAKRAQAVVDKKKDYRHDFKVAAFTVVLTLFLEHLPQLFNLAVHALESVGLLMK